MVKRAQMKSKLLNFDNYKSRWFKLTRTWLYYCDGKLEVVVPVKQWHFELLLLSLSSFLL